MTIIGIDPGTHGALVCVSDTACMSLCMPIIEDGKSKHIDVNRVMKWLRSVKKLGKPIFAVLERVHAMPKQGVSSCFTFGALYGEIRGIVRAAGIRLSEVTPQAWQKAVIPNSEDTKQAAIAHAQRHRPELNLLATTRSRVPHSGIADALCLAEFGRLMGYDKKKNPCPNSTTLPS